MSEEKLKKLRKGLLYIAFVLTAFLLSYILAYLLGYSPLGYEVKKTDGQTVYVQSYNSWGMTEESILYEPPEDEPWQAEALVDKTDRLPMEYHLFFASIMVAVFWVAVNKRKGIPLRRALVTGSVMVFFAGLSLSEQLSDIQEILEGTYLM